MTLRGLSGYTHFLNLRYALYQNDIIKNANARGKYQYVIDRYRSNVCYFKCSKPEDSWAVRAFRVTSKFKVERSTPSRESRKLLKVSNNDMGLSSYYDWLGEHSEHWRDSRYLNYFREVFYFKNGGFKRFWPHDVTMASILQGIYSCPYGVGLIEKESTGHDV